MKKFTIIFIILMLAVFIALKIYRSSEKIVLKVVRPNVLQIDLNNNKIIDDNETFCVAGLETFTSNLLMAQENLAQQNKIELKDAIALGFLTDSYAENLIINQNVKLKLYDNYKPECRFADIYFKNENYAERLYKDGYGIYKGKVSTNFKKNLARAKKLNLAILNHHSNKYHKLDCKYGLISHDAVVVYAKEVPKDAKPCKFCHVPPAASYRRANTKVSIPDILPPPAQITSGSIKFLLTDLTTKLKPDSNCTSQVCKAILKEVSNAKSTIDMAIYGWDKVPALEEAFKNAASRGVRLRIVYDETAKESHYYPDTKNLIAISSAHKGDKSDDAVATNYIMHNKFLVIDNATVITGSMNYSKTDLSGFNSNNLLLIKSPEIAALYTEEFEQMLGGKFHRAKVKSAKNRSYLMGTTKISVYFSPQDRIITNQILQLVDQSRKYVYIPAFLITHEGLTASLINAHKRGVDVRLIIDATNTGSKRSAIKTLRAAGIPVKVENYAGKMHSKSIIIDDKFIVTGSMNFSNSGEKKNDENVLIIEDTRLSIFYRDFFKYLWKRIPDKYLKQNVRAESWNSIGSCADGIDNNFDGKIDAEDSGCKAY